MTRLFELVERMLTRAKSSADIVLAAVMTVIIGSMIVPLPVWALDAGIAINLAAASALLVAAIAAKDALKVAAFPTLLLITTLFRLAMNVSSTRLALSEGHAGEIIQAFGEFVVRGDYVVGAVIFAILTLVQFLVVTKGAERVAEVSARFTLDAMPGKQMSIDADLRAGAVSQDQARSRRRALERESQMFGAMDGAMKFVKGDVIAGIAITFINLLGGTLIGVIQNGMTASEAASTYALIAIGDGLVSQIPSLCIAIAAGLVVTRVSSETDESSLGLDIGSQFFGQHQALLVVAGVCGLFALMPGMPHFTFVLIGAALATLSLSLRHIANRPAALKRSAASQGPDSPAARPGSNTQPRSRLDEMLGVSPLVLDLSPGLTFLVDENEGDFVRGDLERARERLYVELGIAVPPFHIRTGAPLGEGAWHLSVDELPAGRGHAGTARLFAMAPPGELLLAGVEGEAFMDPATGKTISSITEADRSRVEGSKIAVFSVRDLITEHVVTVLRKRAAAFFGVQELQVALTKLEAQSPSLVKEALMKVPLPLMADVLRKLLHEQVSIRNLRAILEALVSPSTEGDAGQLAEKCRAALSRQISFQHAPHGPLYAYLVDPQLEETLRIAGQSLDPDEASSILEGVKRVAKAGRGVVLASPDVRRMLRRLIEGSYPEVAVLTFNELDPELQVRPVGRLAAIRAPAA